MSFFNCNIVALDYIVKQNFLLLFSKKRKTKKKIRRSLPVPHLSFYSETFSQTLLSEDSGHGEQQHKDDRQVNSPLLFFSFLFASIFLIQFAVFMIVSITDIAVNFTGTNVRFRFSFLSFLSLCLINLFKQSSLLVITYIEE